ncbi:hypothetical protein GH714_024587 [Hevea brasiliensis]|uniref:protein-serine/threonine phosphatase n=1 Tax=Hevea brasiliensis TaxID=3981 RepID=A0A6A6M436_HEVBR|nr:hypothetical protein GH714_024587 [Hevea brasiliensis]
MNTKPTTEMPSTPVVSCSLKRKRPPKIEIPNVLQEIQADKLKFKDLTPRNDPVCFSGIGVGVSAIKGNKKFMEDTHKIISCLNGSSNKGFFGVYDGHGGKKAAEFVAENLHINILEMMVNCPGNMSKKEAVKAGYLKTDQEFLKQGIVSGVCCVTALIEGQELVVSNLGDCRAVLCRGGVAEALTKDHRAEQEDERKRIENNGGYVEIHRGAWRVHGILSVSRSIGDAHLKDWVLAEPDTMILQLTPDMEFLVLASDGLWEQEMIKNDDVCYGCVNVSPSSKLRRVSLVKHQKGSKQSPRNKQTVDGWKDKQDDFACENESPPTKSRRISMFKRINTKIDSPNKENSTHKKGPASVGLVAACKELVNLALRRGIPVCFTSSKKQNNEPAATITWSGQSVSMSVYRTKLAGYCRLITITWCKNLMLHGLSLSVQATNGNENYLCKMELKPWYFWRKQGSKQFVVDGKTVDVAWDLKAAKFNGETEPQSDYYIAIVSEGEVVLLLGDLKKDAYRKTRCRPALIEPMLVSRKEHVFGKKKFTRRIKFHEKEIKFHEISVENNNSTSNGSDTGGFDPELEIKVDGELAIQVKHLQWKFRGNESMQVNKSRVEVYWDVHDLLFGSGPRHGLFIFKPVSSSSPSSSSSSTSSSTSMPLLTTQEVPCALLEDDNAGGSSSFCLFLYIWKVE